MPGGQGERKTLWRKVRTDDDVNEEPREGSSRSH